MAPNRVNYNILFSFNCDLFLFSFPYSTYTHLRRRTTRIDLLLTMSNSIERPSTPPNRNTDLPQVHATPEHVRQIEINRLKGFSLQISTFSGYSSHDHLAAKAAQRQKEQAASSSSSVNPNNKRPLSVTPAGQHSPTGPVASSSKPLQRDTRLGT